MWSHRRRAPDLRRRPGRADADENAGSRLEHDRPFHPAAPRRYEALFSVKDRRSYLVSFDAATQKNEDRIVNSVSGTHNASSPVYPMKGHRIFMHAQGYLGPVTPSSTVEERRHPPIHRVNRRRAHI